jgi:hypothetical protein
MGFSAPTARWLREDMQPLLRETLLGSGVLREWTNQATVRNLVETHLSGQQSQAKRLWSLLCLAIWAERFGVTA